MSLSRLTCGTARPRTTAVLVLRSRSVTYTLSCSSTLFETFISVSDGCAAEVARRVDRQRAITRQLRDVTISTRADRCIPPRRVSHNLRSKPRTAQRHHQPSHMPSMKKKPAVQTKPMQQKTMTNSSDVASVSEKWACLAALGRDRC